MVSPAGDSQAATGERRIAHRQSFVTRAVLYRDDAKAAPLKVTLRDVSLKGVGLEAAVPVDLNTRCRLHIEAGPARLTWRLRVVRCGKMGNGRYYVGGQFLSCELSPEADTSSDDVRAFFQ
ncbi:MAG TPA: PilZ domain-containing protein [Tepidisphaeraceae bacterium]|jgi:hypothetical protein|nr:PilZ domain-containing protein [Tepidisphaeraceae bacterium]